MLKAFVLTSAMLLSSAVYAGMETAGSDHYNCPGSGDNATSGPFKENDKCSDECQNLVFDCSAHHLMVNGQVKEIDGENWLGCASQTGGNNASQEHKFKKPQGSACGQGKAGLLPADEPKLESEPLPCDNCVIHRMTKGAETKGCLGLEAKLFDFVYKTCGGCSYKIVKQGGGGGGGGGGGQQATPGGSSR